MPTWTIVGEAGKGWDATSRSLAYYGILAGAVTTGSLTSDGASLSQAVQAYDFSSFAQPTVGQIVKIFRNGTRYFVGEVVAVTPMLDSPTSGRVAIEIRGPFYRMSRTPISNTDSSLVFPTAKNGRFVLAPAFSPLKFNAIASLLVSMTWSTSLPLTTSGVGYSAFSNDECFFNLVCEDSVGKALLDFANLEPNDQVYFDYSIGSGSWVDLVCKRGASNWSTTTFSLGTSSVLQSVQIQPRTDLQKPYGGTVTEKMFTGDGDVSSGGTGTLPSPSRPGYPTTSRTFTAGQSNWFQWTIASSAAGARDFKLIYPDFESIGSMFATGQTQRIWGPFNHTTARIEMWLARQNWLPWSGSISILRADPGSTSFSGGKIQITGGPSAWASMLATVSAHRIDLMTGQETITIAPPTGYSPQVQYWQSIDTKQQFLGF